MAREDSEKRRTFSKEDRGEKTSGTGNPRGIQAAEQQGASGTADQGGDSKLSPERKREAEGP